MQQDEVATVYNATQDIYKSPLPPPAIRCYQEAHMCVSVEDNRYYCYGNQWGCNFWNNDCNADEDCLKYTLESSKYNENSSPPFGSCTGWESFQSSGPYWATWQYNACRIFLSGNCPSIMFELFLILFII